VQMRKARAPLQSWLFFERRRRVPPCTDSQILTSGAITNVGAISSVAIGVWRRRSIRKNISPARAGRSRSHVRVDSRMGHPSHSKIFSRLRTQHRLWLRASARGAQRVRRALAYPRGAGVNGGPWLRGIERRPKNSFPVSALPVKWFVLTVLSFLPWGGFDGRRVQAVDDAALTFVHQN
jgi:hypothetical protein